MMEPKLRRKFQLTDLSGNNNKQYEVVIYDDGRFIATWGRVGTAGQSKDYGICGDWFIQQKIDEKLRKGYVEIDLHKPAVVAQSTVDPQLDAKTADLVRLIFEEAGEQIATYLATGVDALSKTQIEQGRQLLTDISNVYRRKMSTSFYTPRQLVEQYYNTIPTQLPRKIDPVELVRQFDVSEQENRLDQLEAALSTYTVTQAGGSQYQALGAEIKWVSTSHPQWGLLAELVEKTLKHNGIRVKDLYALKVPQERTAYEAETFGAHRVLELFHGTRNPNVRHIVKGGLIIPRHAANGSRFGRGIYLSDAAWRSYQYTDARFGKPKMLLITSAKVGDPWKNSGSDYSMTQPPRGYHSVWGTGSWSNRGDEIIVYRPSQVTLRALVTLT